MVSKFTSQPKNKEVVNKINDVIDAIPTNLATVATSGSYNDLSNKPTIPTVNNATLTIQKNGTTVKTFTANASSNVTCNITVPTKTSDITNDSGYITGITSGDVTTALGYTPYNSTNPNGYISSIPSSYLQNTATGTGALTINGTASAGSYAVNIGSETASTANYGTAIGYKSRATASSSTAIGRVATAGGSYSIAIGYGATISSTGGKSIQLGYGTNSTASSLSVGFQDVGNYQLLDGTTGLIPDARISNNIVKTVNNTAPDANGNVNVTVSGGANIDLSNLSATGKTVIDGQWVYSYQEAVGTSGYTIAKNTDKSWTFSNLPAQNCEVIFSYKNGGSVETAIYSSLINNNSLRATGVANQVAYGILPVGSNKQISIRNVNQNNSTTIYTFRIFGYRKLGTNTQ